MREAALLFPLEIVPVSLSGVLFDLPEPPIVL
jgi:hypothetical protein